MQFKDKYISTTENAEKPDAKKTILSDDAYAIGELIEILTNKLEQFRAIM